MGLKDILSKATRQTGNWLPKVENCNNRVLPCGNPYCADEAMRSSQIASSSPHGAEHAYKHAIKIAKECAKNCLNCPLNNHEIGGVHGALDELARRR